MMHAEMSFLDVFIFPDGINKHSKSHSLNMLKCPQIYMSCVLHSHDLPLCNLPRHSLLDIQCLGTYPLSRDLINGES